MNAKINSSAHATEDVSEYDDAVDGEEAVVGAPGFVRDTPEGPDFRSTPLWVDDRPYDDHVDSREGTAVFDLFTAGHGFQVMAGPKTAQKQFLCRRCGTEIVRPADQWVCEFSGDVTTRPMVTPGQPCQCNWCCVNADVREGRPPERCEACRLLDERDRARANREATNTRHRAMAGAAIQAHPGLDDHEIARMLKVPKVRVAEARIRTGN
ncbi:hypothetical protein [Pseudonocardia sp. ICBG162]|uniref:hypothetical protein n=1 Tax=Pseudonocardia sp. ICBG162 TaxID=2846761 RepID=UPI001CF6A16C|nr:hypothetical protein [Pseudonocardia sp. ICBG162]